MTITLKDFMETLVELPNGCMVRQSHSLGERVAYNGKTVHVTRAIFQETGKSWTGRTYRSCRNTLCYNPDHLINTVEKFWSNIDIGDDKECWEWKAVQGKREYAETSFNGEAVKCHRKAYELFYNTEIPQHLLACHKCDNPSCCNPNHIFLGTNQDNVDDRERKGRNKMPHSLGEEHGIHKLTETQVREIRKLYESGGHSYYTLSSMYGVSFGNIRKIVKGMTWGWLK